MKLTIEIDMDNAAFEDYGGAEVVRILKKLNAKLKDWDGLGIISINLWDVNGNKVGIAKSSP